MQNSLPVRIFSVRSSGELYFFVGAIKGNVKPSEESVDVYSTSVSSEIEVHKNYSQSFLVAVNEKGAVKERSSFLQVRKSMCCERED